MLDHSGPGRDLRSFALPESGQLLATGDVWEPYRLVDQHGLPVEPVAVYFMDLLAAGTPATTLRSYGNDLLRWWRFLWALDIEWDRAVREDARDFMLWMQLADKPVRVHWRRRDAPAGEGRPAPKAATAAPVPGSPNPVTGKPSIGKQYAASTRAHCETVLRTFYDFHLASNSGSLLINPFPLDRSRRRGRANAHHNPMEDFKAQRTGRYRPRVPERIPRRIPDDKYTEVFAGLRSHRDRALLASWVSTGARSEELLTSRERDAIPGQQLIGVIRKGTRVYQQLPASPDAFVWMRLYQEEAWANGVPRGRDQPLWWTLRRPWRPLNYHAARAMFVRANKLLGSNWTLHDLRHTATFRMTQDPELSMAYVQHILGHKYQSTLQKYVNSSTDEVIEAGLAHHARQEQKRAHPSPPPSAPAYNPESLGILFGGNLA
ncbi:tyrosine-type recombinase/integrase [Streptomyces sp. NPDC017940]|uniref:tyrosine-type recombinase/integrase n=1 Tax=Streptomyces sp. NPDC017940 TaxID=3365017 RepID=UPI00379509D4